MFMFDMSSVASFMPDGASDNLAWFFLDRGQIKLADFGLARLYNSEER